MIHNSIIPGDGGAVLTNPPTWKKGNLPTTFDVSFSLAYGAGKFVALNYGSNKAAYSTDGINWIEVTLPVSATWCSVCYGGGKFVGMSRNGTKTIIIYSTDGITWTQATSDGNIFHKWVGICYGNGVFIAMSNIYDYGNDKTTSRYLYSTDGITWVDRDITVDSYTIKRSWGAAGYVGDKFIALSNDGSKEAVYSADGINWTKTTLPVNVQWNSVCYGAGKFVAVGIGTSRLYDSGNYYYPTQSAAYSTDGINWTEATLPVEAQWRMVCYGGGMFVAVAYYMDGTRKQASKSIAYSADGINWKLSKGTDDIRRESVFFGGGKFVVCTENAGNEYLEPTYKELA